MYKGIGRHFPAAWQAWQAAAWQVLISMVMKVHTYNINIESEKKHSQSHVN